MAFARLVSIRDVARDVRLFEIDPGAPVAPPAPGSHVNIALVLPSGVTNRSYSLVGPCDDGRLRIAVKRLPDSRGGSAYMHGLDPGAALLLSEPRNHFPLRLGGPDYLLIAGGIGITPIYGMALALAAAGARFRLLFAARTRDDLAFADDLAARLDDRLDLVVGAEGRRIDLPAAIATLEPGGEAYVCGPIGMLEAAKRAWAAAARPIDRLRFETFGASGQFPTEAFTVKLPLLGREIIVPRHQSMLDALEAAGIGMISDCRRGECGLCQVRIIDACGIVDHRDVFFSDAQKAASTHLCTCVSRMASGSVTIETAERPAR